MSGNTILIAADTVSARPSAATVAWLADELERHGFRCRVQITADASTPY